MRPVLPSRAGQLPPRRTPYYNWAMAATLTIRADEPLRQALQRRASAEGKTVSEVVREILYESLSDKPLEARIGHLKGRLAPAEEPTDPWRREIRDRNWRP